MPAPPPRSPTPGAFPPPSRGPTPGAFPAPARAPTPGAFPPPRLPTPGPVVASAPPGWPTSPSFSPSSFAPPPLPDLVGGAPPELVLETELDFSLEAAGSFESAAVAVPPPGGGLAGLFDGVDLGSPGAAPAVATGATAPQGAPGPGLDVVGAFAAAETSSLPAPPPPPIAVRLRALAERLRAEGRYDDAMTLEEAIAWLPTS